MYHFDIELNYRVQDEMAAVSPTFVEPCVFAISLAMTGYAFKAPVFFVDNMVIVEK